MNLDRKSFENQVFDELPKKIICSNFTNCTFNAKTTFDKCNLMGCTFNKECEFDKSNVVSKEELEELDSYS